MLIKFWIVKDPLSEVSRIENNDPNRNFPLYIVPVRFAAGMTNLHSSLDEYIKLVSSVELEYPYRELMGGQPILANDAEPSKFTPKKFWTVSTEDASSLAPITRPPGCSSLNTAFVISNDQMAQYWAVHEYGVFL